MGLHKFIIRQKYSNTVLSTEMTESNEISKEPLRYASWNRKKIQGTCYELSIDKHRCFWKSQYIQRKQREGDEMGSYVRIPIRDVTWRNQMC